MTRPRLHADLPSGLADKEMRKLRRWAWQQAGFVDRHDTPVSSIERELELTGEIAAALVQWVEHGTPPSIAVEAAAAPTLRVVN